METVKIKGVYPKWFITLANGHKSQVFVSQCSRNVNGEKDKKGLCVFPFLIISLSWIKKYGMQEKEVKKIWNKFCDYNQWLKN